MFSVYSGTTKSYIVHLRDKFCGLELQLYFAFCRQKVENKVVETEPENSSLPADDTSAMKYVSPFFLFIFVFYKQFRCIPWEIEHCIHLTA